MRAEARTRYTQASDSARAFYNLYPTHPHAAAARKLEAIAALRGAPSDAAGKARALGVARAYRQDRNQPATDRFQVALLMERVSAAVSPGRSAAHRSSQATRDQERLVDSLRTEFGDLPDVYALYADLIADAEPTESARLARKVLALPATDAAKAAANSALARQRLIGRSLAIDLRTTGGQAIRLSTPPGKPTVIYFSDPKETFFRDERGTKMPTRWIHVALGAPAGTARSAPPGLNDSVLHCVEPAGLAARICQVLHVREYPFTVVLDAQGKVRDYGRGLNAVELLASQTP